MPYDPAIDVSRLEPLLRDLERAREQIGSLDVPTPLIRALERYVEARGAHMSTRIEGNPLSERDVLELFEEEVGRAENRDARENLDYRDAARLARQIGDDFYADIDGGLIRALHYLVVRTTDPYGTAGQYRTHQNVIRTGRRVIYRPPPPGEVPRRMDELVAWLRAHRRDLHPLILTAVAHVEFVKVHPFDDGNGRTARALTVYFMTRHGWRLRGFVSAEQVFGEDIAGYREQLGALGEDYPLTRVDLTGWVEWFLWRLLEEIGFDLVVAETYRTAVTEKIPQLLHERGLPPRIAHALGILWLDGSVTARSYGDAAGVSAPTATSDLRRLVDIGELTRVGQGRSTRYEPAHEGLVLDRDWLRAQIAARRREP